MPKNIWLAMIALILIFGLINIWQAHRRFRILRKGPKKLPALPRHYASVAALYSIIPPIFIVAITQTLSSFVAQDFIHQKILALPDFASKDMAIQFLDQLIATPDTLFASLSIAPQIQLQLLQYFQNAQEQSDAITMIGYCVTLLYLFLSLWWTRYKLPARLRARQTIEQAITILLASASAIAIFVTIAIALTLTIEAWRFFSYVSLWDFLFGISWSPQMAIRADQVATAGAFGAIPVFAGTLLICAIAMTVAVPIGLFAAIYLAEYATMRIRAYVKPILEILAGIPTIVYGFFAALSVGPFIKSIGDTININTASQSALAAGIVMGIMIIPFISSLCDDVIRAVPRNLREGSLGLGATRSETMRIVLLRAATPGIAGALLLAVSRAIGETMIVVMAAGLAANLSANPFASVTTVTVQIVTLLIGDHEFDGPKTLSAFALGLTLFIMTFLLNLLALRIVRRYQEQYQ